MSVSKKLNEIPSDKFKEKMIDFILNNSTFSEKRAILAHLNIVNDKNKNGAGRKKSPVIELPFGERVSLSSIKGIHFAMVIAYAERIVETALNLMSPTTMQVIASLPKEAQHFLGVRDKSGVRGGLKVQIGVILKAAGFTQRIGRTSTHNTARYWVPTKGTHTWSAPLRLEHLSNTLAYLPIQEQEESSII